MPLLLRRCFFILTCRRHDYHFEYTLLCRYAAIVIHASDAAHYVFCRRLLFFLPDMLRCRLPLMFFTPRIFCRHAAADAERDAAA